MKKKWAILLPILLLMSLTLILAQENSTDDETDTEDKDIGDSDNEKIEAGYECLEEKAGNCKDLTTQNTALTILATPKDETFNACVKELEARTQGDNFGNVLDTALAILALQHAGKNTEKYEDWIITQEKTPKDLIWYLEQDSNEATQCHIGYDSEDYLITINENKKIDKDAGTCLEKTGSNFWLEINPDCYEKEFLVECDKDFITTLLYKNKNSPTLYVLDGTQNSPAYGTLSTSVTSKCFGNNDCDYEASAWATYALLKTGHNIEEYIPYLVALSDSHEQYLPEAFLFIITNHDTYATQLFEDQQLGNFWIAPNSAYDKFYDTALAILSLGGSSSGKINDAKNWLLFSQSKTNGCWQNSIQDTAIVLWALTGKTGKTPEGGGVAKCTTSGYYCIEENECPPQEQLPNFHCSSLSTTCCETENLKSCKEYGGEVCGTGKECIGNEKKAVDTQQCCTGTCKAPPQQTECESNFYTCQTSCTDNQESASYSCGTSENICCKTKTTPEKKSGSLWIWLLILGILIILGIIIWIKRKALKLWWFKRKTKLGKGKGPSQGGTGPKGPPRGPPRGPPGRRMAPPIRGGMRPPIRQRPPQQRNTHQRTTQQDKALNDTFAKLKQMSK